MCVITHIKEKIFSVVFVSPYSPFLTVFIPLKYLLKILNFQTLIFVIWEIMANFKMPCKTTNISKKYWSGFTWREVEMKPYHLLGHGLSLLLANLLIFEDYAIQRLREWEKWIKDKTCERGWKLFFFLLNCFLYIVAPFTVFNGKFVPHPIRCTIKWLVVEICLLGRVHFTSR